MRRSRTGRLLLALGMMVIFVVGVVVIVGEVWVRPAVEDQIADGIVDELGLTSSPDVSVRGFPLVLHAFREKLDGIDVVAEGEFFRGLRVDKVNLHIDHVSFETGDLLRRSGTVRVAGGDGSAEISDTDLSAYLTSIGLAAQVQFTESTVRVSGPVRVADIDAEVATAGTIGLTGDTLTFVPTSVDLGALAGAVDPALAESIVRSHFTFQAPVPQLNGVRLVAVRVEDGFAVIDARFEALDVDY